MFVLISNDNEITKLKAKMLLSKDNSFRIVNKKLTYKYKSKKFNLHGSLNIVSLIIDF